MKLHRNRQAAGAALILAAVLALTACGGAAGSSSPAASSAAASSAAAAAAVTKVTPEQGHEMLSSAQPPILVDVRTAEEYAEKHIPGALNIANETIGTEQPALLPDKNAPVMVYCRSGRRSADAAQKLAAMGYTQVYDLGGINDWTYETEAGAFDEQAALAALAGSTAAAASSAAVSGITFTAQDLDGNTVDQSVFADAKITMVNIWATYCGPCLSEMPELGELASEYKDKNVQIIGVVSDASAGTDGTYSDKTIADVQSLVQQTGANYRHLLPSESLYNAMMTDVYAVPTTLFFDQNGQLLGEAYVGARDKEQWAAVLEEMLAKAGDAA